MNNSQYHSDEYLDKLYEMLDEELEELCEWLKIYQDR